MTLLFIRIFFTVLCAIVGYQVGEIIHDSSMGIIFGLLVAAFLIAIEATFRKVSVRGLSSMVFGLLLGIVMAKMISDILALMPLGNVFLPIARVVLTVSFSYLGAVMALRGKDEFNIIIPYVRFRRQDLKEGIIVLDTSAIIDGRIVDIHKSGFLAGRLVAPRFVLHELQRLADSQDDIKRERGRRGLEILHTMQKDTTVDIRVHEDEMTGPDPVDVKLVRLSKILDGRLCTTDFNLSRMATIQDVGILNIHDLVNAVKTVVFAGEEMDVRLLKEGKEATQAVGYLEDGTMVVVGEGRKHIGQVCKVYVTSVLQTQAGRMIFAKLADHAA